MVPAAERLLRLPFFAGLPQGTLEQLAGNADDRELAAGEYVVRQHDDARYLYFLVGGAVQFLIRVEGGDDLMVGSSSEPGELIGWSAFRPPYRYTASVRCEWPSRFVRLRRAEVEAVIAEDPRLGYRFLRRVAATLANRLEQSRDLLVSPPWLVERMDSGFHRP